MNTGRYTGYFDSTLVDMSAERYVTNLIRLHQTPKQWCDGRVQGDG